MSFLQDAASELLYPVLPIFLTATLGAPVAVVGAVEGIAEGLAALTKLVAGRLADRWPRRPLVAAGAWPVVLAGRAVDRVGKGIRSAPRDALLVDGVPSTARGRVFGLHRAADTAGGVVGPLLGLAAYEALGHRIRPLLILAVLPALLSVALVAAVREASRCSLALSPARNPRPAQGVGWSALPHGYRRAVAALTVFSLVNFPDALLLLRVHQLGFGVAGVVGAYVLYNASYAALSYPAGALADRWPPPRVYALGLLCFAAGYGGLAVTRSAVAALPVLVVYGGFAACTDGVGKAWISTLVPPETQGSAQGLFQAATGAGVLLAGIWAGLAWHRTGQLPLILSALTALVLAAALPLLSRTRLRAP